jgi:hypothetical protein
MVTDNLLKLDESDADSAWTKKAIKECASTAFAGKHT